MIVDVTDFYERQGFCDRLVWVTFLVTVAKLRGDSVLYFRQIPTEGCPGIFLDLLDIRGFKLKPWSESLGNGERRESRWENVPSGAPSLEAVRRNKPGDLNIDDDLFLDSWLSAYRLLMPKPPIQERIESLGVDKTCVGFHVRMTDKIRIDREPDPWKIRKKEMPSVERWSLCGIKSRLKELGLRKVFLACDDLEARLEWKEKLERWKFKVIVNEHAEFDADKFRQTSGEDFVIDLFSLSRCQAIVGTIYSQVPLAAARIGSMDEREVIFGQTYSPLFRMKRHLRKLPFMRYLVSQGDHF